MKWTDLALVFACIFLTGMTMMDLSAYAKEAVVFTEEEYNRMLDRVVEDALFEAVLYEGDEQVILNEEKIIKQLCEGLFFDFSAITEEERLLVISCVDAVIITGDRSYRIYEAKQREEGKGSKEGAGSVTSENDRGWPYSGYFSVSKEKDFDAEEVRKDLESYLPGKLSLSYIEKEEWYQTISSQQVYVVFSALPVRWPDAEGMWTLGKRSYPRIIRSSAALLKRSLP